MDLVTGGTGFVGTHVIRALLSRGGRGARPRAPGLAGATTSPAWTSSSSKAT